jgi:hypothetical protein
MGNDQLLIDVANLISVIAKDRFLREKLMNTEEFYAVTRHIAPEMNALMAILSMRRKGKHEASNSTFSS